MKKLFADFKKFISKGNVIDLAVGMIIGAAFTAIVNALVNYILKPLIAAIPGTGELGALQIVLRDATLDDAGNVLTDAVILDFGEVISAIISFFLTAIILFIIVKLIVTFREKQEKAREALKKAHEDKLRAEGKLPPEEPQPEAVPEEAKPTTEELLAQIRDLLAAQRKTVTAETPVETETKE
ncbi:MAG TPA: large conductance mechanosensitive channel protein MscL [Candidatus Protoclostridium stercorigallinarum]|uniref:Large-conductance mechanosensitive channel n=1 Tax=Candidatus Protoclostridium stercorigallinarum TaxID=2838741 RepID=A0A9D1Q172_9FIRM|nr:large conductance mechanosensitive channel protein MscL [Candidatus Protoclostridium stercorigallinarum]